MRIVLLTMQMPFIRGGAEIMAEQLQQALRKKGHEVETIAIPFRHYPPEKILDHIMACRLLDASEFCGNKIDLVIGLKFPAYLIPHPNKVMWLLHQHRSAYDLHGSTMDDMSRFPNGQEVRHAIINADRRFIPECKQIFTIAQNVSNRLKQYCDIDSTALYHPPSNAHKYYRAQAASYLLFPSRVNAIKRQRLVLEALAIAKEPIRIKFLGAADNSSYLLEMQQLAEKLNIASQVEWLGSVDENTKIDLYAKSTAVVFPPLDEDYGYVTLEAMLSGKAVLTCTDSGGPLEFVTDRVNGLVVEPTPKALAAGMDLCWRDPDGVEKWGERGLARYHEMNISWDNVIERLLS